MAETRTLLTADDLARLSAAGDGKRYELIRGELVEMAPTSHGHGHTTARFVTRLTAFVESSELGGAILTGEPGFKLQRGPDTVRAPDIAYLSAEKFARTRDMAGFPEIVPDLVVEVVSPGDTASKVQAKAEEWLAAGVPLVLVAYPTTRSVLAFGPGDRLRWYRGDDTLDGEPVLPGFTCRLADIF